MEHNRGLRSVTADMCRAEMPAFLDTDAIKDSDVTEAQSLQRKNGKEMLDVLRRRLKICVPSLDQKSLESWIQAVQWIDGREVPF